MTPSVYDLDDRLRGRALYALSRYNEFDADSEHDWGAFILPATPSNGSSNTGRRTGRIFRPIRLILVSDGAHRVVQQPLDDVRLDFHFRQACAEGAPQVVQTPRRHAIAQALLVLAPS